MGDYCVRVRVTYGSYVYPYGLRKRRVRWDFVADFVVAVSLENRYFADNICFTAVVFVSAFVMPQKCRVAMVEADQEMEEDPYEEEHLLVDSDDDDEVVEEDEINED